MAAALPHDPLEAAVLAGAINALRRRAAAIRKHAAPGIIVLDRSPPVVEITSESATSLKIAKSFDEIADDLETEARP
jgi:hypothetical protein